jgi:hypothetical protein
MLKRSCLFALVTAALVSAQPAQPPQTARQAFIEMLFGGSGASFMKHLPDATKAALMTNPALNMGTPDFTSALKNPSKNFQSFSAGPILFSSEDKRSGEKTEVNIDRDDLMGDRDEIDLSFHASKHGQEISLTPFLPKLTIVMGLENNIWKLKEIGLNLRLPLDDPQFLKAMKESFAPKTSAVNDMSALSDVHMLLFAEERYRTTHPDRGYSCSLTELASMHFGSGTEARPILDGGLAAGVKDNYKFTIAGCGSVPSSSFQITAVPLEAGQRAYCADESRNVKFSADGQAATCLAAGEPAQGQHATAVGTIQPRN